MVAPVLVFAIGNESRGDDAFGPLLLRDLDIWLTANELSEHVELLEEFQLQVENAIDMRERRLVLFVDAGMGTSAPFAFYRVQANAIPVLYSHALAPEVLLNVYAQFYQEAPPDVFVLCIRGDRFELGEGLSARAVEYLESALEFSKRLLLESELDIWCERCTSKIIKEPIPCESDRIRGEICAVGQ